MRKDSLGKRLLTSSVQTVGARVISLALSFSVTLVLARYLGAVAYGAYAYAETLVGLLAILAIAGMDRLIVREAARYHSDESWGLMRGLLSRSSQIALLLSATLALIGLLAAAVLAPHVNSQVLTTSCIALLALPVISLIRIKLAALQGLHRVALSQIPEQIVGRASLVGLVLLLPVLARDTPSASAAMIMRVASLILALVIAMVFLARVAPQQLANARCEHQTSEWLRSCVPLLFLSSTYIVLSHTDTIMLGSIKGTEAAGVYVIARKGADLIALIPICISLCLAPSISRLYTRGETERLQRLVTASSRMMFLGVLACFLVMITASHWYFSLFGQEYLQGRPALLILCLGLLLNVTMGPVNTLLVLTGNERASAVVVGIGVVSNIALNAVLIPRWGISGAAIATATSSAIWNIALMRAARVKLGVHTTALGRLP